MTGTIQNSVLKKIFEYDNYRQFLGDFFTEQKKLSEKFSNRYFALKAGFKSSSFLLSVIKGRYNLTHSTIQKTVKALGIDGIMANFFENLVFQNQAHDYESREKHQQKLEELRKQSNFYKLDKRQYEYIKKWYFLVVREVATLFNWNDDFRLLAKHIRPSISTEEARAAITLLIDIGLLYKDDTGAYHQNNASLNLAGIPKYLLTNLKKQLILRGIDAIEIMNKNERFAAFSTLTLSKESFTFACDILDEARKKIIGKALNDTHPEKVYEMNVLLFPVSQPINRSEHT